jgi:TetR/AcrR family transcriptional repressor of nem operon
MSESTESQVRLTAKGLATRDHIVGIAADLIHRDGVQGTTNDDVRKAAGISGSQLSHYFRDKESLVRAVISRRAEQVIVVGRTTPTSYLDSVSALRQWASFYIEREDAHLTGCRFGSLASEVLKSDLDVKDDVAAGFRRWEDDFRAGLSAMRDRGELRNDADPERLAYVLLAAYQGGMLLTQASQNVAPLEAALTSAIDYVATFVTAAPSALAVH